MLYKQQQLYERLITFLSRFGLKRYWIAEVCDLPRIALYGFASGSRAMTCEQANRLDSFMSEYEQINANLIG